MRVSGPVKRTASLVLAGTIGVLAPGVVSPVLADQSGWKPPEVDMSMLPDDNDGEPLQTNELTTECIQASNDRSKGDIVQKTPWGQQYLQLEKVHRIVKDEREGVGLGEDGDPMTVAVIDTGVSEHRWLDVEPGGDYVNDEEDTPPGLKDCDGHGTLVAGIIAADTPEHIGFQGVAPQAEIFSVRQSSGNYKESEDDEDEDDDSSDDGSGDSEGGDSEGGDSEGGDSEGGDSGGDSEGDDGSKPNGTPAQKEPGQDKGVGDLGTLARAVRFAAEEDSVDVMNISIDNCNPVGSTQSKKMQELHAAVHWAVNKQDVVVVASAGNTGEMCKQNTELEPRTIVAPPWFDEDVLTVGAIDSNGSVANFSMHGPWVDVAAPGTEILSLDPASKAQGLANRVINKGKPTEIEGTSYAAPYVSGIAALVRSVYPNLDAKEVMQRIKNTAQHPASPGGHSQYTGYGVVNPVAALTTTGVTQAGNQSSSGPVRADLPDPVHRNWTPVIVAVSGTGGALLALLITLFTVHTIRRNRGQNS